MSLKPYQPVYPPPRPVPPWTRTGRCFVLKVPKRPVTLQVCPVTPKGARLAIQGPRRAQYKAYSGVFPAMLAAESTWFKMQKMTPAQDTTVRWWQLHSLFGRL